MMNNAAIEDTLLQVSKLPVVPTKAKKSVKAERIKDVKRQSEVNYEELIRDAIS